MMKRKELLKRGLAAMLSATMAFTLAPDVGLLSVPVAVLAREKSETYLANDEYGIYFDADKEADTNSAMDAYGDVNGKKAHIFGIGYKELSYTGSTAAYKNSIKSVLDVKNNFHQAIGRATVAVDDASYKELGQELFVQLDGATEGDNNHYYVVVTITNSKGDVVGLYTSKGNKAKNVIAEFNLGKNSETGSNGANINDAGDTWVDATWFENGTAAGVYTVSAYQYGDDAISGTIIGGSTKNDWEYTTPFDPTSTTNKAALVDTKKFEIKAITLKNCKDSST